MKADAYGHGLLTAAHAALEAGAVFLGVSSLEEGEALRVAGIKAPVLILGSLYPFDNFSVLFDRKLTPTVASIAAAEALQMLATAREARLSVHLKIDSGFGRIGVSPASAVEFIRQVHAMPGLEIEGLYTHFAGSDVDPEYTRVSRPMLFWVRRQSRGRPSGVRPKYILSGEPRRRSSVFRKRMERSCVPGSRCTADRRPYAGAEKDIKLTPVLTWKTRIIFLKMISVRRLDQGLRAYLDREAARRAWPRWRYGYADGLPRILSNKGQVLVGGRRVPILGRVTMDMTMVDVTDLKECHVGDEVVLIGRQGDATTHRSGAGGPGHTNQRV